MTWSIAAHDPASGAFAVAVATRAFAVGASCPFVRAGVGAVSTQSMTNRYLGPVVLDGMARGLSPAAAIEAALVGDEGKGMRQIHAVDRHGRWAAFTGRNCVEWCGDVGLSGASFAGNMLSGPAVLHETRNAFASRTDQPFAERLITALDAGEAAGGDRRGRQSAALVLVTTEDFPDLSVRVDDHREPLVELRRLYGIWLGQRAPFLQEQPSRSNPSGTTDMDAIEARWQASGLDIRFRR